MDAQYVICLVLKAGSTIQVDGERLAVGQPGCIDDDLRELISNNRDAVYNHLKTTLNDVSDEAIILKMQYIIELVIKTAWDEYSCRFAETEAARQITTIDGLTNCTPEYLDARAEAIVIRMIQARGQVPNDWTKVSRCARCGPVWSDHGIDTLSCGWCHIRVVGKEFPRP
jgi:hypothetical protein